MEKKGNSSPKSMCKKIRRAFNASPTFRRISARISPPQDLSGLESLSPINSNPIPSNKKAKSNDLVPIIYDYSSQVPKSAAGKNLNVGQIPEAKSKQVQKPGGNPGVHIEDRFTEFINSARAKIGHVPNPEEHKDSSRRNQKMSEVYSMKDRVSDYIDRTRKKLRTTSEVNGGKSNSIK